MARLDAKYLNDNAPLDTPVRYIHDECGNKRPALIVTRKTNGFLWHCHFCGEHGFVRTRRSPERLREYFESRKSEKENIGHYVFGKDVRLPEDFTLSIPDTERLWFYKYELTDEDIARYGFGYSERLHRIIMPIYQEGELVYWSGRTCFKDYKERGEYKYMNVRSPRDSIWFLTSPATRGILLVEDMISAIKVSKATGLQGLALLSTFVPTSIYQVLRGRKPVLIWLDPDAKAKAIKWARQISQECVYCKPIYNTNRDPKEYSTKEILSIIYS